MTVESTLLAGRTFDALFRPGAIAGLRLRNRVVKSPNTTATANADGTVSERTVNHYRRLGEGGIGLVLVEYTYFDDDASKSIHGQTGISRQDHVAGLGWLVDEVHSTGAAVGIQLVHCGRQRFLGTSPMNSASASSWDVAEMPFGVVPEPLTREEIIGVDLPEPLHDRLRAAVGADIGWLPAGSVADARAALAGTLPVAPAVVLIGYDSREAWSVLTLLRRLFALPGGLGTRALLVTEAPRSSLPVCLADES
jgi:hypothetical protein